MKEEGKMKPTDAQLDFIETIQEFVKEKFAGTTKKEATFYIQRNIDEYKRLSSSDWAIVNGYD